MRIKTVAPIIIIGFIIAIFFSFTAIAVIDAPHNASNNISCGSCHGEALHYSAFWGGSFTPADIDDTPYNRICLSCHTVSSPGEGGYPQTKGPLVRTHSDLSINGPGNETWTRECRTCHDPHYQKQKNYKNTESGNLYLATGTITSFEPYDSVSNTTTLHYSPITYKSGWYSPPEDDPNKKYLTKKTSDYRRTILFPNVGKLGYNYPVTAVDSIANTITVTGDATAYLYPPTTFAVLYGQYVKDTMDIKADPSVSPPPASIYKTVKFFDQAGTKSFADGDITYNGACEVCHTTTIFHTNIGDGTNHFDAQNCTTCHPHIEGFKPSCKGCHGYPPPSLATLGAGPTGSTTPGAHVLHVTTKGYQCSICHYNSAGSGTTHNNNIITLGFVSLLGAYTGGSYDGQTSANYQSSDAGTTVSKTGNKQCSNIYCHGGTMAPNGGTAWAKWDDQTSADCNTCHGASTSNPPLRGSHQKHAGPGLQLPCSDCHNGYVPSTIPSGMATHVNNEANFAFDTAKNNIGASASYNGTPTMLDAYGYCSSTYCHKNETPQWGATNTNTDCTWCHGGNAASAKPITLVNHPAHMNQEAVLGTNYECAQCHKTTVSAGNDRLITGAAHANGTKDVSMLMDGTWTAGTAICSSVYCHSSGKGTYVNPPAWGSPTNLGCNGCHGTSNAIGRPDYANEGAGLPNANSHISHVTISTDCNTCHTNTTTTGTAIKAGSILHTNQTLDVNFDTTKAGGSATWTVGTKTCSNISCHCDTNAQWGQTLTCNDCHSKSCGNRAAIKPQFIPTLIDGKYTANSHHVQGVAVTGAHCYQCHWEANADGTINGIYHGGSGASGSPVDLVIYGVSTRPATYISGTTAIQYTANGTRWEIKNLNSHCLGCHSTQNNATKPFDGDTNTPKRYAWDGMSIDARYSQTGTTTWGKYGGAFISESFENNPGYDETGWTETVDSGCGLDPDSSVPGTPPDAGSQSLKATSSAGCLAFATLDHGTEQPQTFTSFYLYVAEEGLENNTNKRIGALQDSEGMDVFVFRLNKNSDQLRFNLRVYNGGTFNDYYTDIFLNDWYRMEFRYDKTSGTWEWRLNGTRQGGSYLAGVCRNGVQTWNLGFMNAQTAPATVYFDSVKVNWGDWNGQNVTPKNMQAKAYSAHGNAINNQGGWDLNETWANTRNGSENIACFDCHNSHGSTAGSVDNPSTSYVSATTAGGILKDTMAGIGGYSTTYKPQAGGLTAANNAYNAGAGLCFDCHMNASSGTTPWGYNSTFGGTQPIMGYWDTPYFGPGTSGAQKRFAFKLSMSQKGGHFGASSGLSSVLNEHINGLCTPCHDPHGVSPSLGTNMQYGLPLLKGTWLTSPYKEDIAPANNVAGTIRTDKGKEGVQYHIDQNTFGSDIKNPLSSEQIIQQSDTQFAGLCLNCHQKNSLTDGVNHQWKSKDRIHESVKGWKTANGTIQHNYSCSKCHTPHNSRLPRLMVTNCLDKMHKGQVSYNPSSPIISGSGNGYKIGYIEIYCSNLAYNDTGLGGCALRLLDTPEGSGNGSFPGSYSGTGLYRSHTVTCHENNAADQSWNVKTQWSDDTPIITSGPSAQVTIVGTEGRAIVTWTTSLASTSYVDYGLTSSYGSTIGNNTMVTGHSITLTNLSLNATYHYRVRSTGYLGHETISGDYTFYISVPSPPVLIHEPDVFSTAPASVTLEWNPVTSPTGDPIEYYIQVSFSSNFNLYNFTSDWITGTSWTVNLPYLGTWYWRVQARDAADPFSLWLTAWSSADSFIVKNPPPAPTLIHHTDVVSPVPVSVTLQWNAVTCPDGDAVQYSVQVDDASDFSSPNFTSDWITGTSWTLTVDPNKIWYWRVQARDSYFLHMMNVSPWSTADSFNVLPHNPPPAPTLWAEPDIVTTEPTPVTLQWWAVTSPDGNPVEYYVEVDDDSNFGSINYSSGWISGASWTVTMPPGYWSWRVKTRCAAHTIAVSPWSTVDSFNTMPLPSAPTLIHEPDVVSTVPVPVTLEWNPVTCPDGDPIEYYVKVYDPGTGTTHVSGWISGTSWTVTLETAKTWNWWVQARDAVHTQTTSPWSIVDSFRVLSSNPPPAPTLIHQTDVRTSVAVPVTLSWNAVTDPDGDPVEYYVQVSQYSNFPGFPAPLTSGWISGTSWTVTLDPAKTWYWRVLARDATHTDATSPWSAVDSFNTFSADPPPAPTLIHQTDGAVNTPVTLIWNPVTCPDGHPVQYSIQVSHYSNFLISDYTSGWISGTNWTFTPTSANTLYWRIQARDVVHTDAVSSWSTADSFIVYQTPSAPTLIHQPDIVSSVAALVTLTWNPVSGPNGNPVQYYVQVDDASDFSSPDYTSGWITGTSWSVTLPTASTWYWRIQARDSVHTVATSSWSTADSFSIFTVNPPPAPTLVDEPNVSIAVPVSVTLDWNSVTCPDGDPVQYYVQVDDASNFSSPDYTSGWISGTSWTVSVGSSGTWYWRVVARDSVHTDAVSPWSGADSFIIYGPPAAPTLIDEPDIVSPGPVDTTLEWNSVTSPDGDSIEYYVQVDDASDYSSPDYNSGWISGTSWIVSLPTATTWYWRVKARDAIHTDLISSWSTDFFVIYPLIINESFERNPGYDETGWTPSVGSGCSLNPDFSSIPGTPPPGAGSQCLQSISAASGYQAYANRTLGSEQPKTFTTFYVYLGAEGLGASTQKDICTLADSGGNTPVILRLFKGSSGNLRFRFRLYNAGVWTNYDSIVISLDAWYKIEIEYDDTNHIWECRLDGTTQGSGSLTGSHYTGIQQWVLGFQGSQAYTGTIYFDLIKVNTMSYQ